MNAAAERKAKFLPKFMDLLKRPLDEQLECFLKAFIFQLQGNEWQKVVQLADHFQKYVRDGGEGRSDLNVVQASDFLQKHGLTRTASERSAEIKDIDLDADQRISLIEYLLLHYKAMILISYHQRTGEAETYDLSNGAIGVTNVGDKLLEELFTAAAGVDPEIEAALEEFTAMKKARQTKIEDLEKRAEQGGVKGMAAKNELEQVSREDLTGLNRVEITLNAAKRRAAKNSGELALKSKKQQEEEEEKRKRAEGRARLSEKAAMFGQK